jgi:type II secretory pathway pseudopilin PulG
MERRQKGFTFIVLLMVFAVMGITLAAIAPLWHQVQQREKERELLFIGQQYILAIRQYYESSPGGAKQYPPTIQALILDDRQLAIRRYLRRPYRDPLTNTTQWGVILAPEGGIMGIYSLAPGTPIKQANFPFQLGWSDKLESYADWRFVYLPAQTLQPNQESPATGQGTVPIGKSTP